MSSLRSALDELKSENLEKVTNRQLGDDLVEMSRQANVLEAEKLRRLAEFDRRRAFEDEGFLSSTAWLAHRCRQAAGAARAAVRAARALLGMPAARAAATAGDLDISRLRMLVDARTAHPGHFSRDEAVLVEAARTVAPGDLRNVIAYWRGALDHDAALRDAETLHRRRRLSVFQTYGGMVRVDGDLDPESGEVVLTALRGLTEPVARSGDDDRSAEQRRADALVDICRDFLDRGEAPVSGGERPHITLTVDLETLEGRAGRRSELSETGVVNPEAALRLACDASISRVITQGESQPLDVGRRTRTVPPAIRRALEVRDGGCTAPGCDRPPRWCDAHHIRHWINDEGPTSLENLVLLCRRHHRAVHEGEALTRSRPPPP